MNLVDLYLNAYSKKEAGAYSQLGRYILAMNRRNKLSLSPHYIFNEVFPFNKTLTANFSSVSPILNLRNSTYAQKRQFINQMRELASKDTGKTFSGMVDIGINPYTKKPVGLYNTSKAFFPEYMKDLQARAAKLQNARYGTAEAGLANRLNRDYAAYQKGLLGLLNDANVKAEQDVIRRYNSMLSQAATPNFNPGFRVGDLPIKDFTNAYGKTVMPGLAYDQMLLDRAHDFNKSSVLKRHAKEMIPDYAAYRATPSQVVAKETHPPYMIGDYKMPYISEYDKNFHNPLYRIGKKYFPYPGRDWITPAVLPDMYNRGLV